MALQFLDRVWFNTATTGTGTVVIGSALTAYQLPAAAGATNGSTLPYVITDGSNWEIGVGTYSSTGPTLTRGPTQSTNSGAAINLSGNATVFIDLTSETIPNLTPYLNTLIGDSGSGGTKGLAPAPSAGDAAAGKFLSAAGGYQVPPGTIVGSGGLFTGQISATVPTQANTGFTNQVNFAGSTIIRDASNGIQFFDPTSAAGENWRIADKAIPAAPFTATALILFPPVLFANDNMMLLLRDGTGTSTGKIEAWGASMRPGTNLAAMRYSSPTAFVSFDAGPASVGGSFLWLQIKDDGTTLFLNASGDGLLWTTAYSATYAASYFGARPTRLGIGVDPQAGPAIMTLNSYLETSP